jgi:hypothetical protein
MFQPDLRLRFCIEHPESIKQHKNDSRLRFLAFMAISETIDVKVMGESFKTALNPFC